jgi:translation initiation factor 2 subunit 2|eukprot:Macronucleus_3040.p1 GENE.Macronucleus_3040~~Macronucleus_3040.p1  ORF type:complete len:224 (+),score=81.50 Macronucleus_3040:1-672(+)
MAEEPKVGAALTVEEDESVQVDFGKMKKKKKKVKKVKEAGGAAATKQATATAGFDWNIEGHKSYEFSELLNRIETIMNEKTAQQDEEAKEDSRGELPQTRFVSTKTSIQNFDTLCMQLDRDKGHLLEFLKTEMDVEGNFGSEGNVLLQGRHKGPMVNGLYKKYVEQYVRCLGCKSIKTEMSRDPSTRLLNLKCKVCDATRTCQNIKKGFHAIRRGERRAQRQK